MPILRHDLAADDGNGLRTQMRVHRFHETKGRDRRVEVGVGAHRQRMDAGIGAAGAMHHRLATGNPSQCLLDMLLHAGSVRLPLPAHEGPPVIFDGEGEAGHGRGSIVEPRAGRHGEAAQQIGYGHRSLPGALYLRGAESAARAATNQQGIVH